MDREVIDEIRKKVDIVELISRYVSLKPSGGSYKGVCPFHEDNDPSLTVDPTKKLWHCFGCGAGGDVFNFLMDIENLSFPDAVKELAAETGVKIPDDQRRSGEPDLAEIMNEASTYFHENLQRKGVGRQAREYLESRGYGEKVIKKFSLGYSLSNWTSLTNKFKKDYPLDRLQKVGLINKSDDGRYYDRFRNRLMIPIKSARGKVIAFGGRILNQKEEGPKYLNSPNTPLFKKGHEFFGLSAARRAMSETGRAILVEGYTDVIAPHSREIKNVIASMGTALTEVQANLLARYVDEVVIAFDRDQAGEQATLKSLRLLRNAGLDVKIGAIPEGSDPADLVENKGANGFKEATRKAVPFHQFYIEVLAEKHDLSTVSGRERGLKESTDFLSNIVSPPLRHELVNQLKDLLRVSEAEITNRIKHPQRKVENSSLRVERSQEDLSLDEWVIYFLMEGVITYKEMAEEGVLDQIDPQMGALAKKINERRDEGLEIDEVVNKMGEKERKKLSQISLIDVNFAERSAKKAASDLMKKFKQKKIAKLKEELRESLSRDEDEDKIQELQQKISTAQKELQKFK